MSDEKRYAYLPEDLLLQMLEKAPKTAQQLVDSVTLNDKQIEAAKEILSKENIILSCPEGKITTSIMAADGANIVEHKIGSDIILAIAVGVDGLSDSESPPWPANARQYQSWLEALPHHTANSRLSQGVMFLMEMSILSENNRDIRILDGSHLTFILKLNSLLSAKGADAADQPYVIALSNFLTESYEKVIPDIPNMLRDTFSKDTIIGITKYSSSREIIDSLLKELKIYADDKTFLSSVLKENQYTKPMSVGQSEKHKNDWEDAHIICKLKIEGVDNENLNTLLKEAIEPFKITDEHQSELYFCYYKPYSHISAYRLEIKKSLAEDTERLQVFLRSIKKQIMSYEIREPYPQYLADIIAKNISFGMDAVNEAISNHPTLAQSENLDIILSYRTR